MWTGLLVLLSRIQSVLSGVRLDRDLKQEITSHLEMLTDENIRRGMTPDEAHRQARLHFGGVVQIEERHREQRGFPIAAMAARDARYAVRMLRKNPGFAIVAVLTLAIGIGASTAMFSIVHAVLLRPLPYADPARLVDVSETNPLKRWTHAPVAPANLTDWQKMNTVFRGIAGYIPAGVSLTGSGEPQRLNGIAVTGNLFDVLGAAPLLGRTFTHEETFEGKSRVVVLSFGSWQQLFGGDPQAVGRTITLDGRAYEIVGVMPPAFFFPARDVQIWKPLGVKPSLFIEARRPHWFRVVARLRPGVSLDAARGEMNGVAARLEKTYPDTNTRMGVRLEGFHATLADASRPALLMLLGAVGVLFLIVCANLANLQLGRAAGRTREMTVRQALGASRGQLMRQMLTEGLVLSAIGGALGFAAAAAARVALMRFAPDALPAFADLQLDRSVILFNVALAAIAPMLFGLIPAMTSSRANTLNDRSESLPLGTRSLRDLLIGCEVALSIVLVIGAGLLIRSLIRLEAVDPGFSADRVVALDVRFPTVRYPEETDALRAIEAVERRLRSLPHVVAAGATTTLAMRGFLYSSDATVEGRAPDDYERELRHESVSPEYFRAMGVRLVAGRLLNERDRPPNPPVMLANESLARIYFRGADAVGKRITFGRPQDKEEWITIVGVVADHKQDGLDAPVQPEAYVPLAQEPGQGVTFVVRTTTTVDAMVPAIRAQVREIDRELVLTGVTTLQDVLSASTENQRFRTSLLAMFAGIALFLAALGIYGVLAYFVSQRSREIGIRLALGASPARLFGMVVRQGMRPVVMGSFVGLAGAYVATGLMRTLLFGVEPLDVTTYGATAIILAGVSLCACAVPASRATHVDPLIALRTENL